MEEAPGGEAGPEQAGQVAHSPVATVPSGAFPHVEHRQISCLTCHESVPSHITHGTVGCTECHGTPEGYGSVPVRSDEDCMSCHHDRTRGLACSGCHGGELPTPLFVAASLDLSTATAPVTRDLEFAHARHGSRECTTCHSEGVHFEVGRSCASCHAAHDDARPDCSTCHEPALDRHETTAHLGCGGSGRHDAPGVLALPEARPVCLSCHAGQTDHEPGGECADCHFTGRIAGPRPEPDPTPERRRP